MASRPTFTPVYEEDEGVISARMLAKLTDWRVEPGDFMYDAVVPSSAEVKLLQINQDQTLKSAHGQYAEDDDLDNVVAARNIKREPATYNKRSLSVVADAGVVLPKDYKLTVVVLDEGGNPLEYITDAATTWAAGGSLAVAITCKTAGTIGNIAVGSEFIMSPPLPGVRSITDTGTTIAARDVETDDALYARYEFEVQNPDTGGNKSDYVRWTEAIDGVGKAKCLPRWNGNGTVKVIVVGEDYLPASPTLVATVQEVLDPWAQGLGEGKAPCGAVTTAVAATAVAINIATTSTTFTDGYDPAVVKAAYSQAIADYLKTLVFINPQLPVVYNKVAAILTFTDGVSAFTGLIVNGGTADVAIADTEIAILGTVTL